MKYLLVGCCCALLACSPAPEPRQTHAPADDDAYWPRFHGPLGDNRSTDTGLSKRWPDDGPPLAWRADGIGEGFSGVTMANGLIYTTGILDKKTMITALDMDGTIQWQVENGVGWTGNRFPGARGTPTIDGDRLYHKNGTGSLVCLNAKTGKLLWEVDTVEKFGGKVPMWGLAESVLIDGDRVICCPGGQTAVVALDKTTGETVWKSKSHNDDDPGYASPVIVEQDGRRLLLTMTAEGFLAVDPDDGKLLCFFEHQQGQYRVNALTPLYHEGQVFISSGYGITGSVMLKLEVKGDQVEVSEIWASEKLDNHHGGVMLLDGYLYGAAHKFNHGKWICLDWKTGEMKHAEKGVGEKGSSTWADGLLYSMSENRHVGLVEPTPDEHRIVSRFQLPRGGKGKTWAHPVVCGGRLYLRHGDFLYAYELKDRGDSGTSRDDTEKAADREKAANR